LKEITVIELYPHLNENLSVTVYIADPMLWTRNIRFPNKRSFPDEMSDIPKKQMKIHPPIASRMPIPLI